MKQTRNGLTKTGFCKSFGCCSHFTFCDMGRGNCYYRETDPAVQEGCQTWLRHHRGIEAQEKKEAIQTATAGKQEPIRLKFKNEEFSQLSLFD